MNILDEQRQVFLALILRDISILIWNSYGNLELSYKLIKKATRINVSNEVKALIHNELNKFIEIKNYREINGTPMRKAPRLFTYYGCGVDMKYQTKCFVLFSAPILPLAKYNCEETQSGYIFYGKLKLDPLERLWKISFISIALLFFIISRLNYNN